MARTYFYTNEALFVDLRALLTSLNLSLSHFYAYHLYLRGLESFLLSVGRTRMRENLRQRDLVLDNRAFSTSLFNLVTTLPLTELKNPGFLANMQNKLAKVLIDIARPLTRRMAGVEKIVLRTSQMGQGSVSMI